MSEINWIPVGSQLPPVGESVLGWVRWPGNKDWWWESVTYQGEGEGWSQDIHGETVEVSHWARVEGPEKAK